MAIKQHNIATKHEDAGVTLRSNLFRAVAIASCAFALVACKSNNELTGSVNSDYNYRHPITLQQSAKTIDIPVGMHSERLTPSSRSAIAGFARGFLYERAAVIQVMVPSGARNESSAGYMAREIRTELLRNGVKPSQIDILPFTGSLDADSAIRLAYPRVEAKTLPCGTHPQDLGVTRQNLNNFDFGCSTQQNFAAMVANPQDLIQPRGWDPRDSQKRSQVTENYRTGAPTWSEDLGSDAGSSSEVKQ